MEILINSYKRAKSSTTHRLIPSQSYRYAVHEFEADDYRKEGHDIFILPDKIRGSLPKVKNYILDNIDDDILLLDDDIYKLGYHEKGETKEIGRERFLSFLEKYTQMCKEWGFQMWGLQVSGDKQNYREYSPFSTLSYVSSSFAVYIRGFKERYDINLPLKEDYDMSIQQCNINRGLLRLNKFFYLKKSAENIGGCAMYRSIVEERQQLQKLKDKWGGGIVKFDQQDRSHSSNKSKKIDINPVIKIPIKGI